MSSPKAAPKVTPNARSKAKPKGASKNASQTESGKAARQVTTAKATPPAPAGGDLSARATALAREIDNALADGKIDALSPQALQAMMAALCRCHGVQVEAGTAEPPLADRNSATGTDIMVLASGLLKAGNLAVFELGMWQAWTGR